MASIDEELAQLERISAGKIEYDMYLAAKAPSLGNRVAH
jgi:hypothetical protein